MTCHCHRRFKRFISERKESSKTSSAHIAVLEPEFDIFDKYSNYEKLLRVVAFCLRFINAIKCGKEGRHHDDSKRDSTKRVPSYSINELEEAKVDSC